MVLDNCVQFDLSLKGHLRIALKESWKKYWVIVFGAMHVVGYAYITVQIMYR